MRSRRRVHVVGVSGAGKSTVGRRLAAIIGCRYVELDSLYHQPGWVPMPVAELRRRVEGIVAGDSWVIDGNYQQLVGDQIRARADTLVWLDPPRWQAVGRVARRSIWRIATRRELWNGNREEWRNLTSRDPDHNIVLWTWQRHAPYRSEYEALISDPANSHLEIHRLQGGYEVQRFLEDFESGSRSAT